VSTKKTNRLEVSSDAKKALTPAKLRIKKRARENRPSCCVNDDSRYIKISDLFCHFSFFNWACNRNKRTFLRKILVFMCNWWRGNVLMSGCDG